jgi:hypothetical protein
LLLNVALLLHTNNLLLLLKQQIDQLVALDQQLQTFLAWVSQKSSTVPTPYKLVAVRAFYFDLSLARALALLGGTLDLARAFNRTLTCNLERHLALDLALDRALGLDQVVELTRDPQLIFQMVIERAQAHARALNPALELALQLLKQQLPNRSRDSDRFKQWWLAHGRAWTEQLRAVTISYRNLGHNWQFSDRQREALKHYYDANCWLVDCLNTNCYMTGTMRSFIEKTLLLPIAEIWGDVAE